MEKVTGYVTGVNGNLVSARFSGSVRKNEVGFVKIGNDRLKGEVIRISGDAVSMQIYEMTNGIQVGDEVELTGELLSVELGPGLLTQVYDGLQNPLPKLAEQCGFFLERGVYLDPIPDKEWEFTPCVKPGDAVLAGDAVGSVPEGQFTHLIMAPFDLKDEGWRVKSVKEKGVYHVRSTVAVLENGAGEEKALSMVFSWPVKQPIRCYEERLRPDETAPWALAKDESKKARLGTVLYNLLESIRFVAVLLSPFLPETSEKILAQINTDIKDYDSLSAFGALKAGTVVGKAEPLFARIDAKEMFEKIEARAEAAQEAAKEENAEVKEAEGLAKIGIEDFSKVELKVAEIKDCEPVKKAKKLLKLTLDDGSKTPRTVASGIAKWYKPEELIGHKVIVVSNLKPAVLCGVESNGMILAADAGDEAKVVFVDGMPNGAKIR